jgi:transposase
MFCFRGRKDDLSKVPWHGGAGMSLYLERLEAGKFIWPTSVSRAEVQVPAAQFGYLLEEMDWRIPPWTQRPVSAGSGSILLRFSGIVRHFMVGRRSAGDHF